MNFSINAGGATINNNSSSPNYEPQLDLLSGNAVWCLEQRTHNPGVSSNAPEQRCRPGQGEWIRCWLGPCLVGRRFPLTSALRCSVAPSVTSCAAPCARQPDAVFPLTSQQPCHPGHDWPSSYLCPCCCFLLLLVLLLLPIRPPVLCCWADSRTVTDPQPTFTTECRCGKPARLLLSHTERNPERWFFKCGDCNYFSWADEVPANARHAPPEPQQQQQAPLSQQPPSQQPLSQHNNATSPPSLPRYVEVGSSQGEWGPQQQGAWPATPAAQQGSWATAPPPQQQQGPPQQGWGPSPQQPCGPPPQRQQQWGPGPSQQLPFQQAAWGAVAPPQPLPAYGPPGAAQGPAPATPAPAPPAAATTGLQGGSTPSPAAGSGGTRVTIVYAPAGNEDVVGLKTSRYDPALVDRIKVRFWWWCWGFGALNNG